MKDFKILSFGSRTHNNNKDGESYIEKEIFIRFKLPTNQFIYLDFSLGFRKKKKGS